MTFRPDLILTGSMFYGTLPLLLDTCKTWPAIIHADTTAPNFAIGKNMLPLMGTSLQDLQRMYHKRAHELLEPVQKIPDMTLEKVGCGPLPP